MRSNTKTCAELYTADYALHHCGGVKYIVPKEMKAQFFVDGYHWATFRPERHHYQSVDTDGMPNGDPGTWVTLDVTEHKAKKGYENYGMYFKCDEKDLGDEEAFAEAIDDLVQSYEYKDY